MKIVIENLDGFMDFQSEHVLFSDLTTIRGNMGLSWYHFYFTLFPQNIHLSRIIITTISKSVNAYKK